MPARVGPTNHALLRPVLYCGFFQIQIAFHCLFRESSLSASLNLQSFCPEMVLPSAFCFLTPPHLHNPLAKCPHKSQIMGNANQRQLVLAFQFEQQIRESGFGNHIEGGEWLIENQ